MRSLYITQKYGILKRKDNSLFFKNNEVKKEIPINQIDMIHIFGNVTLSSGAISLLTAKNIPVYFYNRNGKFKGYLMTPHYKSDGIILIKQFEAYYNKNRRLSIAKSFLKGAKKSMMIVLKNDKDSLEKIKNIDFEANNHSELLGKESNLWKIFYSSLRSQLKYFSFERREYNPPKDEVNALISFGNSVLYSTILSKIYETGLNPKISYLHEIMRYRDSLIFDISEIFKPLFVGKFILYLINKRIIREEHFISKEDRVYLNDEGIKTFLYHFDKNLEKTFHFPKYKRNISNKTLIKYECYNLINALLNNEDYTPLILKEGLKI